MHSGEGRRDNVFDFMLPPTVRTVITTSKSRYCLEIDERINRERRWNRTTIAMVESRN